MLLQLGSGAFKSLGAEVRPSLVSVSTPNPRRSDQKRLLGNISAFIFDFDGTLTATPGDRAARKYKIMELTERAPLLQPWLRELRNAGITLCIMSKSTQSTIQAALEAAGLGGLFDGPVLGQAVGLEGKAGFIEELCLSGGLAHLGPDAMNRVLLVDDDVHELMRASERGIQTFPAPEDGGLQEDDLSELFEGLGLRPPAAACQADRGEILRLWTCGLAGRALALPQEPTQVNYPPGQAPKFSEHYDVDREDSAQLGKGSFGVCRLGVFKKTGIRCAVKFIRKDVAGRHYLETFVDQDLYTFLLKMSREDPHPNVLKQLDYLMGPKVIYNPQELLEGQDLLNFLQENAPIRESTARQLMRQVLAALRHIHGVADVGLIHRDVKLENLRFRKRDPRSDLVLIDFGLCCTVLPEQKRTIVGTLLYMAPEIFSHHYNAQVDLWSVGIILYIILTGKPPWVQNPSKGIAPNEELVKGKALELALAAQELAAAPGPAKDLLGRLMVVAPGERLCAADALAHPWFAGGSTSIDLGCCAGPLIEVAKETYAVTKQISVSTPKSMRVGLTWSLELDDPEPDELEDQRTQMLMPRSPATLGFERLSRMLGGGRKSREVLADEAGSPTRGIERALGKRSREELLSAASIPEGGASSEGAFFVGAKITEETSMPNSDLPRSAAGSGSAELDKLRRSDEAEVGGAGAEAEDAGGSEPTAPCCGVGLVSLLMRLQGR